ncbi:hypothetical protein ABY45_16305 [Microbacterium maritypicum]|uniref:hypothetical protein n=1 Tax=Microbacterium maritypicum TaxID=33918 RepID=UPI003D6F0AFA
MDLVRSDARRETASAASEVRHWDEAGGHQFGDGRFVVDDGVRCHGACVVDAHEEVLPQVVALDPVDGSEDVANAREPDGVVEPIVVSPGQSQRGEAAAEFDVDASTLHPSRLDAVSGEVFDCQVRRDEVDA